MPDKFTFTVFTPTYNRERTLHRVFESLCSQTFKDFEWVIIDDGSTDGTSNLVKKWMSDENKKFPICYYYQENQHRKTAFNNAVNRAQGKFFVPSDSDDKLTSDSLETYLHYWNMIPKKDQAKYSGITALCEYQDGSLVGDKFPCEEWIDSNPLEITYHYRVKGEKSGMLRTDVLKEIPYPNLPGYVPNITVWYQLDNYKTRFINKVTRIYFIDDSEESDQLTRTLLDYKQGAIGWMYFHHMMLSKKIHYFRRYPGYFILSHAPKLLRFRLHFPNYPIEFWPTSKLGRFLVVATAPLGLLWFLFDLFRMGIKRFK